MKRILFSLSVLLVLFHPAFACPQGEIHVHFSEPNLSFSADSKHTTSDQYICLLDEDNEDSHSTERKKNAPEKELFSRTTFNTVQTNLYFGKPVSAEKYVPSTNFIALRVLRL